MNLIQLYIIENILDEIDKIILNEEYKDEFRARCNENIYENKINLNFKLLKQKKFFVRKN